MLGDDRLSDRCESQAHMVYQEFLRQYLGSISIPSCLIIEKFRHFSIHSKKLRANSREG